MFVCFAIVCVCVVLCCVVFVFVCVIRSVRAVLAVPCW